MKDPERDKKFGMRDHQTGKTLEAQEGFKDGGEQGLPEDGAGRMISFVSLFLFPLKLKIIN